MGEPYAEHLAAAKPEWARKWADMAPKIPAVTAEQKRRLHGFNRTMHVLMYSGAWCGDCVRQGPMLKNLVDAADETPVDGAGKNTVDLRIIDRDASAELADELRILDALRVPTVVFLSEDFFEVGRFGDRMLTAYRAKAERELGPACDTGLIAPPPERLGAEQGEWLDVFERMLLMLRLSPMLRHRHGD